jgi:hypothetical protein
VAASVTHHVVRVLIFLLGLAILIDTLLDNPSSAASLALACLLMGVISVDQIRYVLERRDGSAHRHADQPEQEEHGTRDQDVADD